MSYYLVDINKIRENLKNIHYFKNICDFKILYSFKSLPLEKVIENIVDLIDGIEISNRKEYHIVKKFNKNIFNNGFDEIKNTMFVTDDIVKKSKFLYRVNFTDHNNINFLEKNSLNFSRFGGKIQDFKDFENENFHGFHFHLGRTVDHSNDPHLLMMEYILRYIERNFSCNKNIILNIGGSLHRIKKLETFFLNMKELIKNFKFGKNISIYLEAGRIMSLNSIDIYSKIKKVRNFFYEKDKILDVYLDCSYENHLKWHDDLSYIINGKNIGDFLYKNKNEKIFVKFSGSTCYEKDVFPVNKNLINGYNTDIIDLLKKNEEIIIKGANGYCLAWMSNFNGTKIKIKYKN